MFDALWCRRPTPAVRWGGVAALLMLLCAPACKKSPPANVAATVNNRAITYTELERTYQQSQLSTPGQSDEQTMAQKLEVLRGLIDSEIMLQRAEKQGLLAGDADVEAKLTELKAPWTKEQFEQQLRDNKMTLDDLKSKIRRESEHSEAHQQGHHFPHRDHRRGCHRLLQRQQGQLQSGRAARAHGADSGDAQSGARRGQP